MSISHCAVLLCVSYRPISHSGTVFSVGPGVRIRLVAHLKTAGVRVHIFRTADQVSPHTTITKMTYLALLIVFHERHTKMLSLIGTDGLSSRLCASPKRLAHARHTGGHWAGGVPHPDRSFIWTPLCPRGQPWLTVGRRLRSAQDLRTAQQQKKSMVPSPRCSTWWRVWCDSAYASEQCDQGPGPACEVKCSDNWKGVTVAQAEYPSTGRAFMAQPRVR